MKKVITYGTFDLIHPGHINILKRAKNLGDHLIVGLSNDDFNKLKNKKSYFSYEERRLILESIKYVDEIIPEKNWEQKTKDIQQHNVDIFVMGSDWDGKFDFLKTHCEVKYLPRTEDIPSTQIRRHLIE